MHLILKFISLLSCILTYLTASHFLVLGVAATPYQNLQLAKLAVVGGESLFPVLSTLLTDL